MEAKENGATYLANVTCSDKATKFEDVFLSVDVVSTHLHADMYFET